MRLRQLRYFITVAEELSFTRVSARLHIEPSPLSRAIRDLTHDVGVNLLHRSKGKIRLTWSGEVFCRDTRRVLAPYDAAKNHAHRSTAGSRCRIRIGIADSLAQPRLTQLLEVYREEEPLTTIDLSWMTGDELLTALNRDLIDAGFTIDGEEINGFVREAMWLERPVVAIPRHHPLLALDRLPLAEVLRYPLILCHPEQCAGGYKLFQQSLRASGLPSPMVDEYILGHEPMMMLVAAGYGVGIRLESQMTLYNHPDIIIRPVTEELTSASTFIVTSDLPSPAELERFIGRARTIDGLIRLEGNHLAPSRN